MYLKPFIAIGALAALTASSAVLPAWAQSPSPMPSVQPEHPYVQAPRHARRRIEINPRPLLYRRCVDWYELQYRPSGTVLFPRYRCWWVRG